MNISTPKGGDDHADQSEAVRLSIVNAKSSSSSSGSEGNSDVSDLKSEKAKS
jgi:hypothetical protein